MLKALVYKELRETLWLAGIGLLAYLYIVMSRMGIGWLFGADTTNRVIPFVSADFLESFCLVSVPLAIALALRQSVGEALRGTWLFLLHRPARRGTIIALKMTVGVVLYLICAALPILTYALWAARPGTHASPFEWSMTLWAWQAWLSIATLYFAAFLVGMRRARWFGSRLFPLAAAGVLVLTIQFVPCWWLLGTASLVLLDAWLIAGIFYVVQTQDF
jgi:hypothetical protein